MEASEMFGWLLGIRYKFSDKICSNIMFSQARIWDSSPYYSDYRYGLYAAGNIFYNINSYLQYGIEYIWGKHSEFSHESSTDNRIQTTLKFSF